ncbi:MAG: hypothetical protein ABSD74_16475 [Rhizomicrobium sp.]|jgi:hypothetical protein
MKTRDLIRSGHGAAAMRAAPCALLAALSLALAASVPATAQSIGPNGARPPGKTGLGLLLSAPGKGQIFGFDVDQNGTDGVIASAYQGGIAVSTFDQTTAKITASLTKGVGADNEYVVDGIFSGDVALITDEVTPQGQLYAKRSYVTMNPVTGEKFNGKWTPSIKDLSVLEVAENQSTSPSVVFAIELKKKDNPVLVVSDVGTNSISKIIKLDPNLFGLGNSPQLGQYQSANQAVIALSPDGGAVGGNAPVNVLIDQTTGKTMQFNGYNSGPYHAGDVNGLAVDPNTGVAATDTELNAQVEFYNLAAQTGINDVQLPCTNDVAQTYSGSGIAVDPINHLFLVTQTYDACSGGNDGVVAVYDESGDLIETITGFPGFAIGEPAPALNPSLRTGWAMTGPGFSQLQQFFY